MNTVFYYIIEPKEDRYNNSEEIGGVDFIVNTQISEHQYISREAIVKSVPLSVKTPIKIGDTVIVHHNIFRRWYNMKAQVKNSSWYIDDKNYFCNEEQIFMYKQNGEWKGFEDFCFVTPVQRKNDSSIDDFQKREPLVGVVEVDNKSLNNIGIYKGDVVGFTPSSEYEFEIDGKRMYKMSTKDICLKYDSKDFKVNKIL